MEENDTDGENAPGTLRVQFIHGLESSPQSTKARVLAEHFESLTPGMQTDDFEGCVTQQHRPSRNFGPMCSWLPPLAVRSPSHSCNAGYGGAPACFSPRRRCGEDRLANFPRTS